MLVRRNQQAKAAKPKLVHAKQQPKVAPVVTKKLGMSSAPTFPSVQFQSTNRYGGKVVVDAVLLADILD
jgi:hypothetical protein